MSIHDFLDEKEIFSIIAVMFFIVVIIVSIVQLQTPLGNKILESFISSWKLILFVFGIPSGIFVAFLICFIVWYKKRFNQ